jgi:hypothetical protein
MNIVDPKMGALHRALPQKQMGDFSTAALTTLIKFQ